MRLFVLAVCLVASTLAFADPTIMVGRNVRQSQVVDPATEFPAGTSVVALSKVNGAAGAQVTHVWRRDGSVVHSEQMKSKKDLAISSSRVKVTPGKWTVDVSVGVGPSLGSASFVVR